MAANHQSDTLIVGGTNGGHDVHQNEIDPTLCESLDDVVLNTQDSNTNVNCPKVRRSPHLLAKAGKDKEAAEVAQAPAVGMAFDSMLEVEVFYKKYGAQQGFGISRVQGSYSKSKVRTATTWRCEAWGDPESAAKKKSRKKAKEMENGGNADDGVTKKRNSNKCFCTAKVYASMNEGKKWVIRSVVLEHLNHNPIPTDSALVKEYRMQHLHKGAKRKLLNAYDVGIPVSKIHSAMARERGGYENMPITEQDLRHVINQNRRLKMEGGDANALVMYFERMQRANPNFFHCHRLDLEGKMKDVLWVDARSQAAYEEFSDAICFDTTYLTNEYALPFANFVGVNHHGQSVLLGCALISQPTYYVSFQSPTNMANMKRFIIINL